MICPYCKKEAPWVPNSVIYGRLYGHSYMCYYCKDCDARVGCHNNTKYPLGTMADKELRTWRMKAHDAIDPVWKNGKRSRGAVYGILKDRFGKEFHIGSSTIEECKKVIDLVDKGSFKK